MRNAINSYMLKEYDFESVCRAACDTGCEWIGLSKCHKIENGKLQELLKKYNLQIHCVYIHFINIDDLNAQTFEINEYFRWAVEAGARFASVILQGEKQTSSQCIAEALSQICIIAKFYNLIVLVEPLSSEMNNLSCLTEIHIINEVNEIVECNNFGWIIDLCHFYNKKRICSLSKNLLKRVKVLHLAGRSLEDSDERNYSCADLLQFFLSKMQSLTFNGWYEVEVLNTFNLYSEKENAEKIKDLLIHTQRAILVGELAVHDFVTEKDNFSEDLLQLGGGIGIMLRLLAKKGLQPIIVSCSGDDSSGKWIEGSAVELTGGVLHSFYPGKSSVIYLHEQDSCIQNMNIIAGNAQPSCMNEVLYSLPDEPFPVYIPAFPLYEQLLEVASNKRNWRVICDFGYYQWQGNDHLLIEAIKKVPRGLFLCLLNGADITKNKLDGIIQTAYEKGFKYIVVTNGESDVQLHSGEKEVCFPVKKVEFVRCACGAGDSLVAGLILGLCRNMSLEKSLQLGIDFAGEKIMKYGV